MKLLDERQLACSQTVSNAAMNRGRGALGVNSYQRELRLDVRAFLADRLSSGSPASWLDLCCGEGTAAVETAEHLAVRFPDGLWEIVGVDLVPPSAGRLDCQKLRLLQANAAEWTPEQPFDLITCVHGLHYVGDKLGLMARCCSWLKEDGLFIANLDLQNVCFPDAPRGTAARLLRTAGLTYRRRQQIIACQGRRELTWNVRYLGADDQAGPNATLAPAVDSHYVRL